MIISEINTQTRYITLIGTPLSQSFAAKMQNAAYAEMQENLIYTYTEADSSNLKAIIDGVRNIPTFSGCAVTKPNKVAVMSYLDEIDPACQRIGSCNTIKKGSDGRLIGYNTDWIGFYKAITKDASFSLRGVNAFLIGAGGAGRAIAAALAEENAASIYITDKFASSAQQLVDDINHNYAQIAKSVSFGDFQICSSCNLIINASGIGMGSTIGQSPYPEECILPSQFYFDACYNPAKTQFLLNAEKHGCRILNGLGMSLYQGVAQVELWTNKKAPVEKMRDELLRIIQQS